MIMYESNTLIHCMICDSRQISYYRWYHIISYHIISYHIISYHIISIVSIVRNHVTTCRDPFAADFSLGLGPSVWNPSKLHRWCWSIGVKENIMVSKDSAKTNRWIKNRFNGWPRMPPLSKQIETGLCKEFLVSVRFVSVHHPAQASNQMFIMSEMLPWLRTI